MTVGFKTGGSILFFEGVKSPPLSSEKGDPQGTPLSCPLFNLYFNDIVHCVKKSRINLFADDVLLWCDAATVEEDIETIKLDMRNVKEYLNMCKLKLNVNKTKCMVIGARSNVENTDFNGDVINRVSEMTLYKCMIRANIDYCSSILFLNKENQLRILQKIQNRALRNITHGNRYSRISDMLHETGLLSVKVT